MTIFEGRPELLQDFRAGVREALAQVYEFYFKDVFRLVKRGFVLSGPPPVAVPGLVNPGAQQDVVQDVFVRAFSESARLGYDGIRPYRPYLLRIAKNLRIDQERRQRRERLTYDPELETPEGTDEPGDAPVPPLSQEDALDFARRRRATLAFLETVDAETRAYANLRFVEELSQAEVASTLQVTRRRTRTLERRLLRGLRRYLLLRGVG